MSQPATSEPNPKPPALDAQGRERPIFLLAFPSDEKLDELVRAFERGDYRTVRKAAPLLAKEATDPAVQDAASELYRRIQPEPALTYLLALAFGLLFFFMLHAYTH